MRTGKLVEEENMTVGVNREVGGGGKHDCWCEQGSWWRRKT